MPKENVEILIKDLEFHPNSITNKKLIKSLTDHHFIYIDDFETVEHWELFKIKTFGLKRVSIIQEMMRSFDIEFKDRIWATKKLKEKPKDE